MATNTDTSVTQTGKTGGNAEGDTYGGAGAGGGYGGGGAGALALGGGVLAGAAGVGVGQGGSATSEVTGAAGGDATDNTTIGEINIS